MDPRQALSQLEPLIIREARDFGFNLLSPFAERHGSWQMDLGRKDGALQRYLSVALTIGIESPTIRPASCEVEFWIGAQDRSRFTRRSAFNLVITEEQLTTPEFRASVKSQLHDALTSANRIAPEELNEALERCAYKEVGRSA